MRPLAALLACAACALAAGCARDGRSPAVSSAAPADGSARGALVDAGVPEGGLGGPALHALPSAPVALVPRPRAMTSCSGSLALADVGTIGVDEDPASRAIGARLAQWLGVSSSLVRVLGAGGPAPARAIVLRLDAAGARARRDAAVDAPGDVGDEAFSVDISPDGAVLRARQPAGLYYAAQTLAQLAGTRPIESPAAGPLGPPRLALAAPRAALPCVHIEDVPAHRVRAMHLDVARHFFSKEIVERFVDLLAFYRFNVFHWHLTDDQGFRLSIRSHPELTREGARRALGGREVSGSYTQDDAREVVAFAKDRFVTVMPEIEMPGHSRAILASHPELSCTGKAQEVPASWGIFDDVLCAGNEATYALVGDVLREVTDVFPSRLVHVGGDEVPKGRWRACPKCRAAMARQKLTAAQLQGAFTKRVGAMLASSGRRLVAWDDSLEGGLPPDGVVAAWQSAERGAAAAAAGHGVIMALSDTVYFNFWQSRAVRQPGHEGFIPWTKVLEFEPRPAGLARSAIGRVLGGEGALWTEYVQTQDEIDTLLLPRLAALSEALWGSAEVASFPSRFAAQRRLLDASRVRYFVEPPVGLRAKKLFVDAASLELSPPAIHPDGVVRFTLDGSDPTAASPSFDRAITLSATTSVAARLFLPGGRASDVVRGSFERATPRPPIEPSMIPSMFREGVKYKYYEGDFRRLPDFAALAPKSAGRLTSLSLSPAFRPERFAVVYDAWVVVPEDGVFRFAVRADDGVAVDVDGVRVLEDDGEHAAREADGEIALGRGPHTVRVAYFQGGGGEALSLECEGPGLLLGRCALVSP